MSKWAFLLAWVVLAVLMSVLVLYIRDATSLPLRHFIAYQDTKVYRVDAHEAVIEGFCTVFVKDTARIAAVCGQHTWSEEVEQ